MQGNVMTYGGCGLILVGEKSAGEHYDLWWLWFDFSWREVCRGTL